MIKAKHYHWFIFVQFVAIFFLVLMTCQEPSKHQISLNDLSNKSSCGVFPDPDANIIKTPVKKDKILINYEFNNLTDRQFYILKLARDIGKEDDLSLTLMGIVMQESRAGETQRVGHMSAPIGKRSYGVMQVKVTAARDVLKEYPEFGEFYSDEELIGRLLYDDEFNIQISLGYIKLLKKRGLSWHEILLAYNLGPSGAEGKNPLKYHYVKDVVEHTKFAKSLISYSKSKNF